MESQDFFSLLDELLPGIPNDVSLHHICTNFSWETYPELSGISSSWRSAIENGLVHDIRVRSCSTETLVVLSSHKGEGEGESCICLYSTKAKTFRHLPPIPDLEAGLPWSWQVIPLDGKIYALGGTCEMSTRVAVSRSLYLLDLRAGKRKWKKLANMLKGRRFFACGVLSGKIYVFGGISEEGAPTSSSEMYDPKNNTWSPIKAMIHAQVFNEVVTMGEELLLYGGHGEIPSSSFQIYRPATDEWRSLQPPAHIKNGSMFAVEGNLYCLSQTAIYIHDEDTNSWRQKHSMSWPGPGQNDFVAGIRARLVVHANNELVLAVSWRDNVLSDKYSIIQSKGFNTNNNEILWETVPYPGGFCNALSLFQPFMGTVDL